MRQVLLVLWLGVGVHATGTPFLESLDTIVERDPRVGQQQAAIDEVKGQTMPDRLSLLPTLSGTVSHSAGDSMGPVLTQQRAGLSLGVNLFKFGADVARMNAASKEIESSKWTLHNTVLIAEADGARSLFDLHAAASKVKVLKLILETRQTTLAVAKRRFKRGLIAKEEVSATEIDLENARAQLRDAEVELISASSQLINLLGHARELQQWPWKEELTSGKMSGPTAEKEDLRQRPDWKAAVMARRGAEERKDQQWGQIFPSLDASLDYGFFRSRFGGVRTEGPQWSGSLSLTIPLFDRLQNYGSYKAAVARQSAAEKREVEVKRLALQEWNNARLSLRISLETAQSRERTLAIARRLYEANLSRFNRGLVSANELRVDQDRFYQSELFAIQGWNTAHRNYVELCHSVGKRVKECVNGKSSPR